MKLRFIHVFILSLGLIFNLFASSKTVIYVDQETGHNLNDGLSQSNAVATIAKGIELLKKNSGDVLIVGPGTYYEKPVFDNLGSSENKKIWIKAEPRGEAIISNMWKEAEQGNVEWIDQGDHIWSAKHAGSFMGSYKDYFLFHYNNLDELKASSLLEVNKPAYGFTMQYGYLYLQLPEGEDPNGEEVKLTEDFGGVIVNISNSPYLIMDGFVIEGGGKGGDGGSAINADEASHHLLYRNLIFRYCRRCVQMPDNSLAEWCEYYYPNFYNFAEDIRVLNNGIVNGVYTLVKKVNSDNGNAYYEGAFAVSYYEVPTENIEVRYCYFHEVFDAENLGQFNHSSTHHNVYDHNYDDNNELECWKRETHHGVDLRVHDNLLLNCMGGPMSHQDVSGTTLYGPHYVYRNVIYITDPDHSHPAYVIKNKNGHEDLNIYYYHNILMNVQGDNGGWGTTNWLFWNSQHRDALHFYNNIFLFDNCTNTDIEPSIHTDNNIFVNKTDMPWLRGSNGLYVGTQEDTLAFLDKENLNFGISENSPAVDMGQVLPEGLPDSDHTVNGLPDAGPFELGENPGLDWPRPIRTVFNEDPPEGFENLSSIDNDPENPSKSESLHLYANYPNPFNSMTKIQFQTIKTSNVELSIYDVQGRLVEELLNSPLESGQHELSWNADDYSSGCYFIHLETEQQKQIQKCLLIN